MKAVPYIDPLGGISDSITMAASSIQSCASSPLYIRDSVFATGRLYPEEPGAPHRNHALLLNRAHPSKHVTMDPVNNDHLDDPPCRAMSGGPES